MPALSLWPVSPESSYVMDTEKRDYPTFLSVQARIARAQQLKASSALWLSR